MSTQPINNPPLESNTKPFILPKVQWLGRQISTFGKAVYSQLAKITNLFYQTIQTQPKRTLALLTGITVIGLMYCKRKSLTSFFQSLKIEPQEKLRQQKMHDLSKQVSETLGKLQKQLVGLDKSMTAISISQKTINNKYAQIESKYDQINNTFKLLKESISNAVSFEEKIVLLETKIKRGSALETMIQSFIEETNIYKNNLAALHNPF